MKKLFILFLSTYSLVSFAQDTVVVQTLTYDSIGRNYMFDFPIDDGTSYEKIIMRYSMRCKDGLISNSNDRNRGCGEWDYSCNTYLRDSSRTDSIKAIHPTHIIPNFSGTTYDYITSPTYSYYKYFQKEITYTDTTSEDTFILGSGSETLNHPFGASNQTSKSQYLWTAAELTTAGLTAGYITGMMLDINSANSVVNHLKVKMKHSSQTSLDASSPETNGFTQVYFLNTAFTNGENRLDFYAPFNWNGTSNVLLEINYTNLNDATDNLIVGHDAGSNLGLITTANDYGLEFSGSEYLDLGNSNFNTINNEVTISFWCYGNPDIMPTSSTLFEGTDGANRRQVNTHLPWSNSNVYWDCGNDGSYDRIDKAATSTDYSGTWNHWAFTKDAVSGEMNMYLNGALWHSGTGKTKTIDLQYLRIGRALTFNSSYYGRVDEFRVWDSELSQTDIADWMYKPIDGTHPNYGNLLASYSLNEGTGFTVNDLSTATEIGEISGNANWKLLNGDLIFKGFTETTKRPNATFLQGVYTSSVANIIVFDTIQNNTAAVVEYQLSGTDVVPVDTLNVWDASYEYTYSEAGVKIDSTPITSTNSITIGSLDYYAKYPMDFEIMSFVTPYGVGLDLGIEGKTWEFDVSDFEPILHGSKRLFMSRGGQNQEQMDIQFMYVKGTPIREVIDVQQIWKVDAKSFAQIYNEDFYEPKDVKLNANAETYKIRASITGHGQEGEFIQRTHFIDVDGGLNEFEWEVWTECSENPVYPQGGTWIFDRAGWCPGAASDVAEFYLEETPGSTVNLDYGVLSATGDSRYIVNTQLVSYGPVNQTLDAAIKEIQRPTNRVEYARTNPACQEPIVVIQNNGTDDLTSLEISYGVDGVTPEIYQWTGKLEFEETEAVVLPIPSSKFWYSTSGSNEIEISISKPNGATDGYTQNNVMKATFAPVPEFLSELKLQVYTNKQPGENSYILRDLNDTIIIERKRGTLTAETFYVDELVLNSGCYSLEFLDEVGGQYGQNGLDFWFYSQFGRGSIELRDSVNYEYLDPDFGAYVKYDFSVGQIYTDGIEDDVKYQLFNIYPNPAHDQLNIEMHGYHKNKVQIRIFNAAGKLIHQDEINSGSKELNHQIDISTLNEGIYFLKMESGNQQKSRKFIKN